jgi:hypothetical protein
MIPSLARLTEGTNVSTDDALTVEKIPYIFLVNGRRPLHVGVLRALEITLAEYAYTVIHDDDEGLVGSSLAVRSDWKILIEDIEEILETLELKELPVEARTLVQKLLPLFPSSTPSVHVFKHFLAHYLRERSIPGDTVPNLQGRSARRAVFREYFLNKSPHLQSKRFATTLLCTVCGHAVGCVMFSPECYEAIWTTDFPHFTEGVAVARMESIVTCGFYTQNRFTKRSLELCTPPSVGEAFLLYTANIMAQLNGRKMVVEPLRKAVAWRAKLSHAAHVLLV